jgi:hypothetical protein
MYEELGALQAAVAALAAGWVTGGAGAMTDAELIAANGRFGEIARVVAGEHAVVAAEIARRSRPELGSESVAKQNGYRNAAVLVAATTGTNVGDAARLVTVGEAITPRRTFTGEGPAKYGRVAEALRGGRIGAPAAALIIALLDKLAMRCTHAVRDDAEGVLVEQAVGLPLDQLRKVLLRAEAHLDPDGIAPREDEGRAQRALHLFQRDGLLHVRGVLDAEAAAPVVTAIQALVSQKLATQSAVTVGAARADDADAPRLSVPRLQADALMILAAHALACDDDTVRTGGATVVVRMTLNDLVDGTGHALIDGIDAPISAGTARRMAANGGIIPWVMGTGTVPLDWGREKRLFTRAQYLALVERDGGCAMCGAPPGWARVHHRNYWHRDSGPTDLDNGVLLCDTCHHRIHDNNWEIHIHGTGLTAHVWFIPPAHIDPTRTPRPGARHRHDHLAA